MTIATESADRAEAPRGVAVEPAGGRRGVPAGVRHGRGFSDGESRGPRRKDTSRPQPQAECVESAAERVRGILAPRVPEDADPRRSRYRITAPTWTTGWSGAEVQMSAPTAR